MSGQLTKDDTGDLLAFELRNYLDRCVALAEGDTKPVKPSHRVKFQWPPHPVSYSFHVIASDWTGKTEFSAHGETFTVKIARTPNGVFGRCDDIWFEARGGTEEEMLANLRAGAEPLFHRQLRISRTLEREGRFQGHLQELSPIDLFKLLYCEDRDVSNDARIEIETHASSYRFLPALLEILNDRSHQHRRSAQWCVLDLFEDLPTYCKSPEDEHKTVASIKNLIWDAEEDYARTIYKAGVVLGGHIPYTIGGPTLLDCLQAPSKIGRRSAIHGLFHVVEWLPEMRIPVVEALQEAAKRDSEPILRDYARHMARDIAASETDHVPDPVFDDER